MAKNPLGSPVHIRAQADRAIAAQLERLPAKMVKAVEKKAQGKLGTKLKKIMQDGTPVKDGSLKRAWGKQTLVDPFNDRVTARVGIRRQWRDPKTGKIPNKYASVVNYKSKRGNRGFKERAFGKFLSVGKKLFEEAMREALAKVQAKA